MNQARSKSMGFKFWDLLSLFGMRYCIVTEFIAVKNVNPEELWPCLILRADLKVNEKKPWEMESNQNW